MLFVRYYPADAANNPLTIVVRIAGVGMDPASLLNSIGVLKPTGASAGSTNLVPGGFGITSFPAPPMSSGTGGGDYQVCAGKLCLQDPPVTLAWTVPSFYLPAATVGSWSFKVGVRDSCQLVNYGTACYPMDYYPFANAFEVHKRGSPATH